MTVCPSVRLSRCRLFELDEELQLSLCRAWDKCLETRDCTAEDQCVHIIRAFVRVHRLQVHHVPNYVVLVGNSVACDLTHMLE